MDRFWKASALLGSLAITAIFLLVLCAGLGYLALLLLLVVGAAYGWMLFTFLHYRQCRQEEFLQVLTAAAVAEAPLAPALEAYLRDRPHGPLRELWVALLLFFVIPGYYWFWYRRWSYDAKVEQVVLLLEEGHSLLAALRQTPGVAARSTLLAVALGEHTGQLARCLQALRDPARGRLAVVWLEMVPRFAYPLLLLAVICGNLQFWTAFIAPKYEKILAELDVSMPEDTERLMDLADFALEYVWVLVLAVPVLGSVLILLLANPRFRWYFPVVGSLYRGYVRSQVLQALSFLLQLQRPVPEALGLLGQTDLFVAPARRRLDAVRLRVERGEPLADGLRRERILPRTMVPLLKTAERAGNLPWALAELADLLAQRSARRVQRLGMVLSPVPVLVLGGLVGVIALGFFVPLVALIDRLGQ
jgi:type II secretory pathway component PulF